MINLPKSVKYYRDLDKLTKYRNKQRKLNYSRGWVDSHKREWTLDENLIVLNSDKTDRELSKEIKRSVNAIQIHRNRLKKIKEDFKFKNNMKGVDLD